MATASSGTLDRDCRTGGRCGAGLLTGARHHPPPAQLVAGAIDIGFAQDMSAHHQQALMICDLIPVNVAPDVRGLASEIRLTQWREIGQMMGWLQMLDAPLDNPQPMAWMSAGQDQTDPAAGEHHRDGAPTAQPHDMPAMAASMPGTASSNELTALSSSTGKQAKILFLQLMIRHHQGGIDMADHAAREAHHSTVKEAALGMVRDPDRRDPADDGDARSARRPGAVLSEPVMHRGWTNRPGGDPARLPARGSHRPNG